jgi:DNA excision repair protein ERCC-8
VKGGIRVSPSHNGSVTNLEFTPDGLYLLSSGTDSQLRRWDIATGENTLVTYSNIINKSDVKHVNFVISEDGSLVYHPNK